MRSTQFGQTKPTPLAAVLRPRSLSEIVGQSHLVGPGAPLRLMTDRRTFISSIIWGPPGCGKTTIVRAMAADSKCTFTPLNATSATINDIRKLLKVAELDLESGKQTLCFIDEIQRFSKSQQDVLLPGVEDGIIVLFGATTEKAKFAVNSTILSRCMIWETKPLEQPDMISVLKRVRSYYASNGTKINISPDAAKLLIIRAGGDVRKLITVIETVVEILSSDGNITIEHVNTAIPEKHICFDATGNTHYDLAKAYQGCIQHSDVDGALYWLARWLASGEDPAYIARRMLITAFEDCSSNLFAPLIAVAASYTTERTGMPECAIALGQATVVMCQSDRSKAGARGIWSAMNDVAVNADVVLPPELQAGNHKEYVKAVTREYVNVDVVRNFFESFTRHLNSNLSDE